MKKTGKRMEWEITQVVAHKQSQHCTDRGATTALAFHSGIAHFATPFRKRSTTLKRAAVRGETTAHPLRCVGVDIRFTSNVKNGGQAAHFATPIGSLSNPLNI